jgi:histidinol-phosphate aminotransferase
VFNVGAPAQAAAQAALADREWTQAAREHNERWRDWLAGRLAEAGLAATPSAANFLLVRFRDAAAAYRLLLQAGVVSRPMGGYGLPHCLRITIGTEEEVRTVARVLGGEARAR